MEKLVVYVFLISLLAGCSLNEEPKEDKETINETINKDDDLVYSEVVPKGFIEIHPVDERRGSIVIINIDRIINVGVGNGTTIIDIGEIEFNSKVYIEVKESYDQVLNMIDQAK